MALAPIRLLSGVPSRSISFWSMTRCSMASNPISCRPDLVEHGFDGLQHALAQVAGRVAVTQLDGLVLAGGGAGRHRGAGQRPVVQGHLHLDGGVAAGIEDLAGADEFDGRHGHIPSLAWWSSWMDNCTVRWTKRAAIGCRRHPIGAI